MEIYEVLKKDHDTLKQLLERLVRSADADQETRTQLIQQIRDELVPHSRAEEKVLYDSLRSIETAKDLVRHSFKEHLEAETLLRSLQVMEAFDANWQSTAQRLKEALEHHIEEEEGQVFEAARQLFVQEEAQMMAEVFQKLKPEVREGSFLQNTLDMVVNMMPKRFKEPFRDLTQRDS